MNASVILAHPDKASFNHALAHVAADTLAANGYQVSFHDLYKERFPPVLPAREIARGALLPRIIRRHCDEIAQAHALVMVHPNWWGQPPAILKGWIDRILRPGVAYSFAEGDAGDGELIGLLQAHTVLVLNTSNTPPQRELATYNDPLETLWKNNMLVSCGVKNFHRRTFGVIITSTLEQRTQWLEEAAAITHRHFPRISR